METVRGRAGPSPRGGAAPLRLVAGAWLLAAAGCGHDVIPTDRYADPARIPVCCLSDPGERCCGLDGAAFAGEIRMSWNAEEGVFAVVDGWVLLRAAGETQPPDSAFVRINPALITASEYEDRDITDGVRYWYRLASMTPAGVRSTPTSPVPVRADFTPPAPPSGLSASVEPAGVRLTWNAPPDQDLDHFNVFRVPAFPPIVFPRSSVLEYVDTLVEPDSTYRYWVTAVDISLNESAPSETVSVTVR
jgi:hypothetical protein